MTFHPDQIAKAETVLIPSEHKSLRIAIIGGNASALVMADALAEIGHEVELFGRKTTPNDLSLLWSNDYIDTLFRVPSISVPVRWYGTESLSAVTIADQDAVDKYYRNYWIKSRGRKFGSPPNRGVSSFQARYKWFEELKRTFDLDRFEPVLQPIIEISHNDKTHWSIRLESDMARTHFDRVVTTLTPEQWSAIYPTKTYPEVSPVSFYWSDKTPKWVVTDEFDADEIPFLVVLNGDPSCWWFRCTKINGRWCHEAAQNRGPIPSNWDGDVEELYSMIGPFDGSFGYPKGVIPVGRFAEWDNDADVDFVLTNRTEYVRKVEREPFAWSIV